MTEDKKVLEMNLAGVSGEAKSLAEHVEFLKKEIDRLKALLSKGGSGEFEME